MIYSIREQTYTANGLELDFYILRNFVSEIQPRQGLNLKRSNERSEIIALRKPGGWKKNSHNPDRGFFVPSKC